MVSRKLPIVTSLDELSKVVDSCTDCGLHSVRTRPAFGRGGANAAIMFVGEEPSTEDDAVGVPFYGAFGQALQKLVDALGLAAEDVYVTHAVKCMTRFHLAPALLEIRKCKPYLTNQIALIQPKAIVALGSTAMKALLGPELRVTEGMGKWGEVDGIPVMPTHHPALWLKEKKYQRESWKHMILVMERLGRSVPTTKRTKVD